MDEIIERQKGDRKPLDLMILTTNLHVLERGREAQETFQNIFSSMQMILTGGSLQLSLHSLAGEFAANGVRTDVIYPKVVFFGAAGLSFDDGALTITYQFQDELSTQISYATRPTKHRVLLCDHTKLGSRSAWKANISIASMLALAERCTIVSTVPDEPNLSLEKQIAAFDHILDDVVEDPQFREKDLSFLLVNKQGAVKRELSLDEKRKSHTKRNGEPSEVPTNKKRTINGRGPSKDVIRLRPPAKGH